MLLLCATTLLGACAKPYVQPPGEVPVPPSLHATQAVMDDGYRLPLSRWEPQGDCRALVLALHGLNDYRNAFATTGAYLASRGVTVVAYDQRGFGETEGFGYWHGSERMVRDLDIMIDLLHAAYPGCPLYVLGESMGGAVTLSALERRPAIDGVILVAPAVWSRDTMPFYQRAALWLAVHTMPDRQLTGKGLDITPSDNIEMLRALGRDLKVIKATRVDVLYGVTNLMDAAAATAPDKTDRALLLYGMHDEIIPKQPTCQLLEQLSGVPQAHWKVMLYENGYHMLTRDLQADIVLRDMADWLLGKTQHQPGIPPGLAQFCADS
ncbi:MAG TPA: alpha/beta fold hydrolase [Gammaproteobacteria bacterium]|nr:alpha/beta fold hydrolase [Gammaproteobacteria bacterium]